MQTGRARRAPLAVHTVLRNDPAATRYGAYVRGRVARSILPAYGICALLLLLVLFGLGLLYTLLGKET
jgi:hypothetical protein